MTTKDDYYRFLKSAKAKRCGGLSGISHLTKNEMAQMAYKLGYSATDAGRRVYIAKNDPTLKEDKIEVKGRKATRRGQPRRQQQQEEKKEETWEEMKERGNKLKDEANKIIEKIQEKQETTERDLTKSKEWKQAIEKRSKAYDIIIKANKLRREKLGLPTIEEERRQKIEQLRKKKEAEEKKEKEEREARKKRRLEKEKKEKEEREKKEKKEREKKEKEKKKSNNGKKEDRLLKFFGNKK